jgi:hypothetical protein
MKLLAAKLKVADPKLRRSLSKRLRAACQDAADAASMAVFEMGGVAQKGLREEVSKTVHVTSTTGRTVQVTIHSTGSRMPEGKTNLPKHIDSAKGWAHPVFARGPRFRPGPSKARKYSGQPNPPMVNRAAWTWVRQIGRPGWFEEPIIAHAPQMQRACQDAIDETLRDLGR